jgi:hypothetical protein
MTITPNAPFDPNTLVLAVKNWRTSVPLFASAVFTFFIFNGFKIPETKEEWAGVVGAGLLVVLAATVKSNTVSSLPQGNTVSAVTVPTAQALVTAVKVAETDVSQGDIKAKIVVPGKPAPPTIQPKEA